MVNAVLIAIALSWCSYLAWDAYKTVRREQERLRRAARARARRLSDCLEVRP